jgi:hypothetical protein
VGPGDVPVRAAVVPLRFCQADVQQAAEDSDPDPTTRLPCAIPVGALGSGPTNTPPRGREGRLDPLLFVSCYNNSNVMTLPIGNLSSPRRPY